MNTFSRKYLILGSIVFVIIAALTVNGTNLLGQFDIIESKDLRAQRNDEAAMKRLAQDLNKDTLRNVYGGLIDTPDSLMITKEGPKSYTYTPEQVTAVSKDKKSLLTQFTFCASGKKASTITGIKFQMFAKANFSFIPYLDSQQLWKSEITDMLQGKYNTGGYQQKIYDIILDKPVSIEPGNCRKFNLMATSIKPGGKWIIPVILGVGSNTPVYFSQTSLTDTWIKQQLTGKNANSDYGLGVLTLFTAKPGPFLIEYQAPSIQAYELKPKDNPPFVNLSFYGNNMYAHAYQLDSFDIELKTNASKPVKMKLYSTVITSNDLQFDYGDDMLTLPVKQIILQPNTPTTIPMNIKLDTMTDFLANINLDLPLDSATYTLKITNIKGNGAVIAEKSDQSQTPFVSSILGTIQLDVSGKPQPLFPPDYKIEDSEENYKGADTVTQLAVNLNALEVNFNSYGGTQSIDALNEKLPNNPEPLAALYLKNYQSTSYAMKYNPLPMSMVFKSNAQGPFKIRAHFSSSNSLQNDKPQDIVVMPQTPFTLQLPAFTNGLNVYFSLLELPKSLKSSYYIQPVINSLSVNYGKDFTVVQDGKSIPIKSGMPAPLMTFTPASKTSKPITLPLVFNDTVFTQSGIFETSSNNIPPPYTKIVDLDTMKPGEYVEMNQFCLVPNENAQITEITFDHLVREQSPFKTVKIDTSSGLSVLLEKAGWSKHTAIFPMSSNVDMYAGSTTCFSLKAQGVIDDSLDDAFFDLMKIKAINAQGKPVKTILQKGGELSPDNPLKGTHFDFL